jgi:hypothetical protein
MNVSFLKRGTYRPLTTDNAAFWWVVSLDPATFSPIAVGRSNYVLAAHSDPTSTSSYIIEVLLCSYASGHRQDTNDGAALGRTFRAALVSITVTQELSAHRSSGICCYTRLIPTKVMIQLLGRTADWRCIQLARES